MAAKSRVAVITGTSSGIGRATAIALCEAGWDVVLIARREEELRETARLCTEARIAASRGDHGHDGETRKVAVTVVGDVTKEDDVKRLFECAVKEYGRIDLLFNNAGITGPPGLLDSVPIAAYQAVLSTNVVASILCTQHAMQQFKSQSPPGGRIINNGSLAAHVPRPYAAAYAISKHAVLGLTRCTSLEGRRFGIAATQIDVGNALTDIVAPATSAGVRQSDGSLRKEATINAKHVASSIVHIAELPLDVTVLEMNIMATEMPYVGRG